MAHFTPDSWINCIQIIQYQEEVETPKKKGSAKRFYFITNMAVKKGKAKEVAEYGRRRWKIENEGFNTQKTQGYNLEHRYSQNYQGTKNHYYLIQTGHMIAQILEAYKKLWKGIHQSREQKHRRILENFKGIELKDYQEELKERCQIRFV